MPYVEDASKFGRIDISHIVHIERVNKYGKLNAGFDLGYNFISAKNSVKHLSIPMLPILEISGELALMQVSCLIIRRMPALILELMGAWQQYFSQKRMNCYD
ncbi:MAG: hypothetical protein ACK5L5_06655 [Bacteroidales bacterium]